MPTEPIITSDEKPNGIPVDTVKVVFFTVLHFAI